MQIVSYETRAPANLATKATEIAQAVAAYQEHGSERKAAAALGIAKTTLHTLLKLAAEPEPIRSEPAPHIVAKPAADVATNPTAYTYNSLDDAYAFFNHELFGGTLPHCLITMQRHKGANGFFAPERFGSRDGSTITDEIALNPATFADRTIKQILSTLAHEMAHLWQQHFGEPSRTSYHNKEWAAKMKEIGLYPSSTAEPGGKETGQKVSHYIIEGGPFDVAFAKLEAIGVSELLGDRWDEGEKAAKAKAKKNASKTAFQCPTCELKAWAKADARLICGECSDDNAMVIMVCASED
jgi:hypothetical protein